MTAEEFVRRWDGMSSRERDVWVAEAVLSKAVVPVRVLEGYRWQSGVGPEEFEPVLVDVPCVQEHGVVAYLTHMPDAEYVLHVLPRYTEDLEAAWEIVEHMRRKSCEVCIEVRSRDGGGTGPYRVTVSGFAAEAGNVAEAIAKAALLAVCVGTGRDR